MVWCSTPPVVSTLWSPLSYQVQAWLEKIGRKLIEAQHIAQTGKHHFIKEVRRGIGVSIADTLMIVFFDRIFFVFNNVLKMVYK